jgi:hypothetical protein
MELLGRFKKWFGSLDKRGKSLVVIAAAAVVILILEGLK